MDIEERVQALETSWKLLCITPDLHKIMYAWAACQVGSGGGEPQHLTWLQFCTFQVCHPHLHARHAVQVRGVLPIRITFLGTLLALFSPPPMCPLQPSPS